MEQNKLKQPHALLAGISMMLVPILWHICSGLPLGYVSLFNCFEVIFDPYGIDGFLDSFLWVLIFFAFIFAAVTLFTANYKLSSIALIVLGGLFLLEDIVSIIFWFDPRTLLEVVLHAAIVLAGLTMILRGKSLRLVTFIAASAGFLLDLIFRIMYLNLQLNLEYSVNSDAQFISRMVMIIIANLFIAIGIIFAILSVDYDYRPIAKGVSFTPNSGQPQQPYGTYPGQHQAFGAQWQQPAQAQQYRQAPYQSQSRPQQPYGQPQQPYGQPKQPSQFVQPGVSQPQTYRTQQQQFVQPQQPYNGQWQQPYAGQPGQTQQYGQPQSEDHASEPESAPKM